MSIRNLDAIFRPKAVALIGASPRPQSVGLVTALNLHAGGFEGPIMPVNPRHRAVAGVLAYPDVASLPVVPDLAIICTPPATVPGLVAELGARGVKGAIVITAGFRELGSAEGRALEQAVLDAARPHLMRIIGPNCVGVISTPIGLNASFAHIQAKKGNVAFVTQSGAMVTTVLDWASGRGIGFSHLVSLGDMTDVDFGDMLDYLANDPDTHAILLYIEAVTSARKFMSAARAASRVKPVIAIKAGRHAAAARAASSHTGALAGVDAVYDAAFRRAGILRVITLDEVFDAVETLATAPSITGDRLAILTNGGGAGVLATDALMDREGQLAELTPETKKKLDAVLPPTWSHNNPVDIIGDAGGRRYSDALSVLLEAPEVDAVLVLNCPVAVASGIEAAQAVIGGVVDRHRPVLTSWLGSGAAVEARRLFSAAHIPTYETPDEAIQGFMHLVQHRRRQEMLMQVPPSVAAEFAPDVATARKIVSAAIAAGRVWLEEPEVRQLLSCYRIPTPRSTVAETPEAAARWAEAVGARVALKIFSPDITHKSDVGGVMLDLEGGAAVRSAAEAMRARVTKAAPKARLKGFVVQEMIRRPHAHELILGMAVDAQFGPFLLFGRGGTAVEVVNDKTLALPPLNLPLARGVMERTRVFAELKGYRDQPAAALNDIALTLVQLSQLVSDLDEVIELDINPLLADAQGVIALDARVRVERLRPGAKPGDRLAIPAYPKALERVESLPTIGKVIVRPVRPEDGTALASYFERMTPEDVRMRFFAPIRSLTTRQLARFTQIDYDREMAFVMESTAQTTPPDLLGIARLAADPDNRHAEFAISVRSDLKAKGIGRMIMARLIEYARQRGIGEMFGDILEENTTMLDFCRKMGFSLAVVPESAAIVRATLKL
jgi:acetyltransferase